MRVVVDPNVVVSALLTPGGAADEIVRTVLSGGLVAVVSPRLLDEVREVAGRPKFSHLDPQNVERVLGLSHRIATLTRQGAGAGQEPS